MEREEGGWRASRGEVLVARPPGRRAVEADGVGSSLMVGGEAMDGQAGGGCHPFGRRGLCRWLKWE